MLTKQEIRKLNNNGLATQLGKWYKGELTDKEYKLLRNESKRRYSRWARLYKLGYSKELQEELLPENKG